MLSDRKQVGEIVIGSYDSCEEQHKRDHCYNCEDDRNFSGVFLPITCMASHNTIYKMIRSAKLKKLNLEYHQLEKYYDEIIAEVKNLKWSYDSYIDQIEGRNENGEHIASIRFLENPDYEK